jgi:hypothetical protein
MRAAVPVGYDLSARLRVTVDDDDARVRERVAAQMDPFRPRPTSGQASHVVLESRLQRTDRLSDIQNPARDGTVTGSDGERFFLLHRRHACVVPDPLGDRCVRFSYEPGFPLHAMYAAVVRPAIQLALLRRDAVAVHSASVEIGGRAVLVAGWSESGKTETALALMEAGGGFLSDKWTVLGTDGEASAFPINVGIRRWVVPYLATLDAALPRRARAQLEIAGIAAGVTQPQRERWGGGRIGALAERAVALADRAALTPTQVRAAYGQNDDPARRVPLGTTALLTTVLNSEVACEPADPAWAAARLARSAGFERRELFALLERRRYAFPGEAISPLERAVSEETRLLERALARRQVLNVRAPFPVDPREVAAAIMRCL